MKRKEAKDRKKVLMLASVASMIDQFNMPNIRLLLDLGYDVDVACNFEKGNTCDSRQIQKMRRTLREMGVAGIQWDCPRSIRAVGMCCVAYRQLVYLLRSRKYAWIHCHSPIGSALARIAAHRERIPVIYTAHGFHFYHGAPMKNWLLYYPAEALLAHWTEVLVTVNHEDYWFAKSHFCAKKVCVIPGVGINTALFGQKLTADNAKKEIRRIYRIPENAQVLLSVGELNKGKNHRIVIKALASLPRHDVYYLICGQGEWQEKLRKYANRLGVGGRVRMPGYQEHMHWIYQNADIFVFPSVREGMPLSLMEAMAAGMPCIVSDIRGNRELIPDRFRFSLRHSGQLRHALVQMLGDEQLKLACARENQKKIQDYDQTVIQHRMNHIYQYMKLINI